MLDALTDIRHWVALAEIIGVNIVLSGDNAVVIALACRSLRPVQQRQAILFGTVGAIVARIVLTGFAAVLLVQPYLQLAGSLLLLWIAIKLILPDDEADGSEKDNSSMTAAIKTIVVADIVMSLDNVLGVAAAAHGNLVLLSIGLVTSMPLIVYGSTLILHWMNRYPVLVYAGAAILGYVAGELGASDQVVAPWIAVNMPTLSFLVPVASAAFVLVVGHVLGGERMPPIAELAHEEDQADDGS